MAFECPRRSSPPSPMFDADTGCIATDPAPSARRRFRSKTGIENLPANEHAQETPHTPSPTRTTRRIQSGCAGSRPRLRDGMPGSPSQHTDITRAKWIPYFGETRGKIERYASGFFLTSQGGDALSSNVATLSGGSAAGELQAQFGWFVPDAAGNTSFVETRSIPNTPGQSFGWVIEVGAVSDPIWWTEQLMLPEAPASWGELESQANVSISRDRRTITTRDESEAIDGLIYNMWKVIEGDPSGQYSIRVTLSDGRSAEFLFAVE